MKSRELAPIRAYSYRRFSTPEQAQGDSLRRQTAAAREYAGRHGLLLDEDLTFQDEGVSAYHGRNASTGALGAFLDAVKHGVVAQGSYLLVESLDRVSRQTVRKAVRTLEDIVEAGINVVDLSDGGRLYNVDTLDNDSAAFLFMTFRFIRAHEESSLKAQRLVAAYEGKRARLRSGTPHLFSRKMPAWLRWDEGRKEIVEIEERASLVREIFEKAAEGWGRQKIVRWLNAAHAPTWGEGKRKAKHWHRSYVQKILTNRAVIGVFTPHRLIKDASGSRIRKPLDPVQGYFPAVVDKDLYERVAARLQGKAARGRHSGKAIRSIFAGLLKCEHCGGTVTRVAKGKYVYLLCERAHARAAVCKYTAIPYVEAERVLREQAETIIKDAPKGRDTAELEQEITRLSTNIDALLLQARDLADELIETKSETVRRRMRDKEEEIERAEVAMRSLQDRQASLANTKVLERLAAVLQTLVSNPFNAQNANAALRQAVKAIVMRPALATMEIYWQHAEAPQQVLFYTKHFKWRDGAQGEKAETDK